jgi:hypothetical protein
MRLLSYLLLPKQTLERGRQRRERELYVVLARGRRRRFQRAMLDRK